MRESKLYIQSVVPAKIQDGKPSAMFTGWTEVTVVKETSGDVIMGTSPNVIPGSASSGSYIPSYPFTFKVGPGTTLYFGATNEERVSLICQPLPDESMGIQGARC